MQTSILQSFKGKLDTPEPTLLHSYWSQGAWGLCVCVRESGEEREGGELADGRFEYR